jgi:hypothetical protein
MESAFARGDLPEAVEEIVEKTKAPIARGQLNLGTYSTLRQDQYRSVKGAVKLLFVGKLSLLCFPQNPRSATRSVDPTGFEPASATVAGCCVTVTPRAHLRVSAKSHERLPVRQKTEPRF